MLILFVGRIAQNIDTTHTGTIVSTASILLCSVIKVNSVPQLFSWSSIISGLWVWYKQVGSSLTCSEKNVEKSVALTENALLSLLAMMRKLQKMHYFFWHLFSIDVFFYNMLNVVFDRPTSRDKGCSELRWDSGLTNIWTMMTGS